MAIVDFIVSNYITILIVVIIILFALIGRYIEKKGFLDPAKKPNVEMQTLTEENNMEENPDVILEPKREENNAINIEDIDSALFAPISDNYEYDKLNDEVKGLLSKKEVIDDNLLSDIDNLSLDKTQKYNFGDIPDLDDVDLPEIKKSDEEEDIWKF